ALRTPSGVVRGARGRPLTGRHPARHLGGRGERVARGVQPVADPAARRLRCPREPTAGAASTLDAVAEALRPDHLPPCGHDRCVAHPNGPHPASGGPLASRRASLSPDAVGPTGEFWERQARRVGELGTVLGNARRAFGLLVETDRRLAATLIGLTFADAVLPV